MVFLCVSALNVKTVDAHAGEMVSPVSGNEYDLLLSKLGGTHRNRVFHFFGVEAPQRTAEALLVAQRAPGRPGDGGSTVLLQKMKDAEGRCWSKQSETREASGHLDLVTSPQQG